LTSNRRPYVNAEIFLDYIETMFLAHLVGLRGLVEFASENVVVLMDNCLAHSGKGACHTFALRTTQIFQVLDLTLFDVLKRRPR
jgi:hypothetical protein